MGRRGAVVAVVLLVLAGAACHDGGSDPTAPSTTRATTTAEPAVPQELPDGFRVLPGSTLLAPVFRDDGYVAGAATGSSWMAVIAVPHDVGRTWRRYVDQALSRLGRPGSRTPAPGCDRDERPGTDFLCQISLGGRLPSAPRSPVDVGLTLANEPDDTVRRYVLTLRVEPAIDGSDGGGPGRRVDEPLPPPRTPRRPIRVGEPLGPHTVAYGGVDDTRYVLLPRSELVAVYGPGSLTGGFQVLLHVPTGSVDAVARAYADQAAQYDGPTQTHRTRRDRTTWTVRYPPGGAGGYSSSIWSNDPPGPGGWILYDLHND